MPLSAGNGTPGRRVLVVDDEPALVDSLAAALRYERLCSRRSRNRAHAVAMLLSVEPQLIVLDWMLPDFDGIEVSRIVRHYRSSVETAICSSPLGDPMKTG